jgi:hypothetical protein
VLKVLPMSFLADGVGDLLTREITTLAAIGTTFFGLLLAASHQQHLRLLRLPLIFSQIGAEKPS